MIDPIIVSDACIVFRFYRLKMTMDAEEILSDRKEISTYIWDIIINENCTKDQSCASFRDLFLKFCKECTA